MKNSKKVVIMFTDGQPGYDGYVEGDAETQANALFALLADKKML